jgi:hypothetical protein
MIRRYAAALAVLVLVTTARAADEPSARVKKLLGTWTRTVNGSTVTFQFKADQLHAKVSTDGATITVEGDYGVTKDGIVFGIITKVTKVGTNDGPAEGDLFRFTFKLDKDKATLKDLKGAEGDEAKQLIQGEYQKKKETK